MKNIYFDGGSDMNGAELGDVYDDRYQLRFSKLICDHYGIEEYNISMGGCGNHRVVRQLLLNERHISEFDLAIIQMCPKWRTEYHDGTRWQRVLVDQEKCRLSDHKKTHAQMYQKPDKFDLLGKTDQNFWKDYFRIHGEEFFTTNEKMYHAIIKSHCKAYGVPLIMLGRNQSSDLEFDFCFDEPWISKAPDGHPNEEGHRAIADRLISMLTKHK